MTVSNFTSKILVFLLVPIYTSVLSTEEYGSYDLVRTTISILVPILSANICEAVMRYCLDKHNDQNVVATEGFKVTLIAVGLGCGLTSVLVLLKPFEFLIGYEWLALLYFIVSLFDAFFGQLARGLDKIKIIGIAGVINTSLMIALNLILLLVFKMGLKGFYIAIITALSASIIFYVFSIRIWRFINFKSGDSKLLSGMLAYSIPLVVNSIGWTINSSLDKYIVSFYCGISATGLIGIAYKIPNILDAIKTIFIQAWQITGVVEYDSADKKSYYTNMFLTTNAFLCCCCGVLIILTRPISAILYQNDFYEAWIFVPLLLISVVLNSMAGYLGPILMAQYKAKAMAKSAVIGIIVNAIFNLFFTYLWGMIGAIIATVISSLSIYILRRYYVAELISGNADKRTALCWLLLLLLAVAEIVTQNLIVELILLLIVIFVNADILGKIIMRLRLHLLKR